MGKQHTAADGARVAATVQLWVPLGPPASEDEGGVRVAPCTEARKAELVMQMAERGQVAEWADRAASDRLHTAHVWQGHALWCLGWPVVPS
jgi:hypothetical protein